MNPTSGGLPRPDFRAQYPTSSAPIPIPQSKTPSPIKRDRIEDALVFGLATVQIRSPEKKIKSADVDASNLTEKVVEKLNEIGKIRHGIDDSQIFELADAIIFALPQKNSTGIEYEERDNVVARSVLYDYDMRCAYIDTRIQLESRIRSDQVYALRVSLDKANIKIEEYILQNNFVGTQRSVDTVAAHFVPSRFYSIPAPCLAYPKPFATLTELTRAQDVTAIQIVNVLYQAFKALKELHSAGIVHGNINFNTVCVSDKSGTVQFLDQRFVQNLQHGKSVVCPLTYGTITYTAPELLKNCTILLRDFPKQDVYAMGIVAAQAVVSEEITIPATASKFKDLEAIYNKFMELNNGSKVKEEKKQLQQAYSSKAAEIYQQQLQLAAECEAALKRLGNYVNSEESDLQFCYDIALIAQNPNHVTRCTAEEICALFLKHYPTLK